MESMPVAETVHSLPADRRTGLEADTRLDDTAGDEEASRRFAEIGLSPRTGWYSAIALYLVGSIPAIALPLIEPDDFPRALLWLGVVSLLMVPFSIVGLRRFPNSLRATHFRLGIGFLIQATGAAIIGDGVQAFVMMPLATILPPAIYFGVREGIMYLALVGAVVATVPILINEPWATAMAVCSSTAIATISISLMVAQARTRRVAREFRKLAYCDPLTGLANARSLHERLAAELRSAATAQSALFAIDLDNFKSVNDQLGYGAGDRLLVATAEALERVTTENDLVVRRGGDEFSVLVSDAQARDLDRMLNELSTAIIEARRWTCPGITPTASVAYVRLKSGDTIGSVLERADDALHKRKSEFHADDPACATRLAVLDQRLESERAGVEKSVLNPPQPSGRRSGGGAFADWMRGSRSEDRPIWFFAAAMQLAIGGALMAVAVLRLAPGFSPTEGLIYGGLMLAFAATGAVAGEMQLTRRLVHLTFIATIVVLSIAVTRAGDSGAALLDLFAIVALFGFHLFKWRPAAAYLVAAVALFGYLAISKSFPFAEARLAVFAVMMLTSATLVAKVRTVTGRFAENIWELSQRDALTGVANVRALRSRIREVTRQARSGRSVTTVIAIDLDQFKQVNDRFNHSTGDATLVAVARAIEDNVRGDDLVARRGGDEFVVVLTGAERREPTQIVDRIAASIMHARLRATPSLAAGASVVHVECEPGDDADSLLARADAALHDRKVGSRQGRISAVA